MWPVGMGIPPSTPWCPMRRFAGPACQAFSLGLLTILILGPSAALMVIVAYVTGWIESADLARRLEGEVVRLHADLAAARAAVHRAELERDVARGENANLAHDILLGGAVDG